MTGAEYVARLVKDLLGSIHYRKFEFAVGEVLEILRNIYGEKFFRFDEWPPDAKELCSNIVVVKSPDDIEVMIAGGVRDRLEAEGYPCP